MKKQKEAKKGLLGEMIDIHDLLELVIPMGCLFLFLLVAAVLIYLIKTAGS